LIVTQAQDSRRSKGRLELRFLTPRSGFVGGIATLILLFYATAVLGCSCIHADHTDPHASNVDYLRTSIVSEDSDAHEADQLCPSVDEHLLSATAVSSNPKTISALPPQLIAITHGVLAASKRQLSDYRPPGLGFLSPQNNHSLTTILRI
jgi:hypothetical protein